ncbi:putative integral membrane protein [Anaerohalosphaera lusitana]|uniref:Putative integral membrane protein n=1 Tax=Anaerohalosphaera lusitana TaxID=1936003 RepID=A0A1U9NJD3_9BACT|nr:lipopolysaccharide assembly protein LapA domain-containing protein [Anaerohalosphaera lusitana]AQT68043.1 putative integral membrane protein [Anaerohalosphaera lusitana]
MKKYNYKTIIAAILILLTVIIIFQNIESVNTKFLFVSIKMPRALLLLITFALGTLTGLLLANKIARKPKDRT